MLCSDKIWSRLEFEYNSETGDIEETSRRSAGLETCDEEGGDLMDDGL